MNKSINSFAVFCILNAFCLTAYADLSKNAGGNNSQDNTSIVAPKKDLQGSDLQTKRETDRQKGEEFLLNVFGIESPSSTTKTGTTQSSNISPEITYTVTTTQSGGTYGPTKVTYTATSSGTLQNPVTINEQNVVVTIGGVKYGYNQTIPGGTVITTGSTLTFTY